MERPAAGKLRPLPPPRPLIGAHMSVSGGVDQAPVRGREVGCVCVQIFTKSNVQWSGPPLTKGEIAAFRANCRELGIGPVMAHACYLINLGSSEAALRRKSVRAFLDEVARCDALGLPALIVHPGSHTGAGENAGLRYVADGVNEILSRTPRSRVAVLLETTAGQGSSLGCRFEHLAEILSRVKPRRRVGVCFDTCHVFAAGYDLRTEDACRATMDEFDRAVGIRELKAFHFNDAKCGLGARVDRHEHIGRGALGRDAFRFILQDPRFADTPKFLETPKGKRGRADWDVINLNLLRRLAAL